MNPSNASSRINSGISNRNNSSHVNNNAKQYRNQQQGLTDMSSPADSGLMDLKRRRQHGKKKKKKEKKEEVEEIGLDECDIGASPTLNFEKRIPKDYD